MLAGGEVMQQFGVAHYVGVFDARMVRIYRRIGSSPEVLGSEGEGREQISVGLWEFTPEAQAKVAQAAGITPDMSRRWFERAVLRRGRLAEADGRGLRAPREARGPVPRVAIG